MRIVGGKYAGRTLTSPADERVRPTAEHVRAAILDLLASEIPRARVVDLFAGSGALGLEALSRGAQSVDFVETRPSSLHALKANIALLRQLRTTRVFKRDAVRFAADLDVNRYGVAFADPPYESRMLDLVLEHWHARQFSRVLVLEHAASHSVPSGALRRTFGDTAVTIFRAEDGMP